MIISILGVWKSGAAYVPMDPNYPDLRIELILKDTKAKIVIGNMKYSPRLQSYDIVKVEIDSPLVNQLINDNSMICNLEIDTNAHNLAYVIYTSGTTGTPKGVMIEHRTVVSFTSEVKYRYFGHTEIDDMPQTILFFSNYVFDFSIEQLVLSILSSNILIILPSDFTIDENFYAYLNSNRLTYLSGTPTQIQQIDFTRLKYLERVTFSGEALTARIFAKIRSQFPGKIVNAYGITETTVYNMTFCYLNQMTYKNSLGTSLSNSKRFVINENIQLLPIHAIGQLCLTGDCLSRGYLNRPELTTERFLPNPFQTEEEKIAGKNTRIYKTGDLVRWLPGGEFEYLGRNDFQVKLRGLRIELGEIEAVLSSYQGVKQCVVLAKDHKKKTNETYSKKYLVGYYVSDNHIEEFQLKQHMQTAVPDYMIPNRLIQIEKIPVTVNGKLDVKMLPDVDFIVDENNYYAPRNELEVHLCEIWSDVLNIEKVGIRDDFFRLGGDSIGSLQIVGRIRQEYDLILSVKDIFTFKTIEKLYDNKLKEQFIQPTSDDENLDVIESAVSNEKDSSSSLLPTQEFLIKNYMLSDNHFHQYAVFKIPRFDEKRFRDSLVKLVDHHEEFRLRLKKHPSNNYSQYYQTNISSQEINQLEVETSPSATVHIETELHNLLRRKADIENGPVYMVRYAKDHTDNNMARVWILLHDLFFDWTSCQIISEELYQLYIGGNLSINNSYKQWSKAIKNCVNHISESEVSYWQSVLNTNVTIFNKALEAKQQTNTDRSETEIVLSGEMTTLLLNECNRVYHTEIEHLLLAALAYTLRDEITSLQDNYTMFECCCRDFVKNLNMDRSIGMFRTIYPVRLQLADDNDDMRNSIINVKEYMKEVPNKGIGFCAIAIKSNVDYPYVSFNYLGEFTNEMNANDSGNKWILLDASCDNTMDQSTKESIKINSLIINKEMRLNIKTKMGIKRTVQFGKAFKLNIEKTVKHTQSVNRSYLTRSDINYVIKNNDYLNRVQLEKEVDAIFMANSLQQGFLYHSFKQSNIDDAYIVQSVSEYRTTIDEKLFKMAWEHAQNRFSCLRLRFAWDDELIQIIDKVQVLDWRFIDLTTEQDVSIQELKIKQMQEDDRNERYKLETGNLFRVYLIQQKSDLFGLILSFHHIILDGWSMPILVHYVHQDYLSLMERRQQLSHVSSPILFEARDETYETTQIYLQTHRLDNIDYWESQINTIEERCDLSGFLKQEYRNKVMMNDYDHVKEPKLKILMISDNLYRNLKKTCRENGFTLSTILLFVWHKILNVYGNSSHTVIGTTISGRNLPVDNIENAVGLFINTLPSIMNHKIDVSVIDAIKTLQDNMNEMINHSNVDILQLNKGNMKRTLFDCLFVYENYPTLENKFHEKETSLKFENKYGVEKLDYALAMIAHEKIDKEHVEVIINYAGELIENDTIDELLDVANHLLSQISKNEVEQIVDLNFLPENQFNIIEAWNNTHREFLELNDETTLHALFEEEAKISPDKIAIVYEDAQLTYRELNERANRLAHYLRSISNIHPDDLIALILDKSELMIISILGVWKSGAAYVPMDPNYPDQRIEFILKDTKAKIMIGNMKYSPRLQSYDILKVEIDSPLVNQLINNNSMICNLEIDTSAHNLAYVIYTSGTTGPPKGVLVEHQSVVSFRNDVKYRYFSKSDNDPVSQVILFLSNYVFDFSIEQLTLSILSSNTLLIVENHFTVSESYNAYLNKNKLTYISGTPTQIEQMDLTQFKYLATISIGGEVVNARTFAKIRSQFPRKILHVYGITETTVYNTVFNYKNRIEYKNSIGSPLSNTKSFVLNKSKQQLPIHAIGELYLTGDCLSRGYLNRPELTIERFLLNPFQTEEEKKEGKNARIYKTGDLVRRLSDGELEYIGRNDLQIKIRGLRIELGEIEAVLSSYQGVKESVVIMRDTKTVDTEGTSRKYIVG
ncbi:unnamed protein product, partial [Rotaria magnacalcarata]